MARKLIKGWYRSHGGDGGPILQGKTYVEGETLTNGEPKFRTFHLSEWNLVGRETEATEADLMTALDCDGVIAPDAIEG